MIPDPQATWWQRLRRPRAAKSSPFCLQQKILRLSGIEELEARQLLDAGNLLSGALPLALGNDQSQMGVLNQTPTIYYIAVADAGRLRAEVASTGGPVRLSLLNAWGEIMMQSDGKSPGDPNGGIDVYISSSATGEYYLEVQSLGQGTGSYSLFSNYVAGASPGESHQNEEWTTAPAPKIRSTPLVGDLNGDGRSDVAVLNEDGQILVHFADAGDAGDFEPPIVLNPNAADSTQDLTLVNIHGRQELASLDAAGTVSLYGYAGDDTFVRTPGPVVSSTDQMLRIVSGDVMGTGRQDLVVASYGGWGYSTVHVYLQRPDGSFGPANYSVFGGMRISDIALAELSGGPGSDIVVTDESGGLVRVLVNNPMAPFQGQRVFRTGVGPYEITNVDGWIEVESHETPLALVTGPYSGTGSKDLMVLDSGSYTCNLLTSDGDGGLLSPASLQYSTGYAPSAMVTGAFTASGIPDVAILDQASDQVLIYLGQGNGHFRAAYGTNGLPIAFGAGYEPAGLTIADLSGEGGADLLIGNADGGVLVLEGEGDGTFTTYASATTSSNLVSEFSAVSGSELAVVTTLVIGPGNASTRFSGEGGEQTAPLSPAPVLRPPTLMSGHDGDADDVASTLSESEPSAVTVRRNAIITGAVAKLTRHDLDSRLDAGNLVFKIPFASPLELLEAGSPPSDFGGWQQVINEVSRWLHSVGSSYQLTSPGEIRAIDGTPALPINSVGIDYLSPETDGVEDVQVMDSKEQGSTAEALLALAITLETPFLAQELGPTGLRRRVNSSKRSRQ